MPALVKRLTAAGLVDANYSAKSLRDAASHEPVDGVYTVANTYNATQTLLLDAHFDRLEDSAARKRIALALDRSRLRQALRQMIIDSGYGDVRFRITVPAEAPEALTLSIEPFEAPSSILIHSGARCRTTATAIRGDPAAKSSDWMPKRESLLSNLPTGIYEVFLLDRRGGILEGLSSNFYAIKNGELLTAGDGVLAGIARKILFVVCKGIISLRLETPQLVDLPQFSEAFLTSSSRGIIPVVEIDGRAIGNSRVGPVTRELRKAYDHWVAENLEEL
ncbi:MAG: aminotransferase class IV [Chloroflexi bacterium]|nr:aminotransferase class IV [Chloroflexota bacterium]